MQSVKGYPIKQYVTGYMKVIWGPDVRQESLFSPGNIVLGDMILHKNIRTGDCKTTSPCTKEKDFYLVSFFDFKKHNYKSSCFKYRQWSIQIQIRKTGIYKKPDFTW